MKFPADGSHLKTKSYLHKLFKEVEGYRWEKTVGALYCQPHEVSVNLWKKFIHLNPNNIGNWTVKEKKKAYGTARVERLLMFQLLDLYSSHRTRWGGYMTSGATEGNLFSAWLGRMSLEQKIDKSSITMVLNDLSHYSLAKAASVVGVKISYAMLSRKLWVFDVDSLIDTITALSQKGHEGFLLPLTLGYTTTGSSDDYKKIVNEMVKLEKKLKIKIYIWIDAALNGLVDPFINPELILDTPKINSFVCDFHKFGLTPIPSGFVLYRSSLENLIRSDVSYMTHDVGTLSGSRSGVSAVASFGVIHTLGRKGFERVIKNCLYRKKAFILRESNGLKKCEIVDIENGVAIGLVTNKPLGSEICRKYGLFSKKKTYRFSEGNEDLYIYKMSFLYRRSAQ
ncbi:pyridoxal-dependent decarboxylase [Pseudomonadota bacterium]